MSVKLRKIEVDPETADLARGRATARGNERRRISRADIACNGEALPADLAELRAKGEGPWSPEALDEDARRLAEFERTRNRRSLGRGQGLDGELGHSERASRTQVAQAVKLVVSSAAAADLERPRTFLMSENPSAAQRAVAALTHAIQSLDEPPGSWPARLRHWGLAN